MQETPTPERLFHVPRNSMQRKHTRTETPINGSLEARRKICKRLDTCADSNASCHYMMFEGRHGVAIVHRRRRRWSWRFVAMAFNA
jgi:hypothetical protein